MSVAEQDAERQAALAQLQAYTNAHAQVQEVALELLELRYRASVRARRAGTSMAAIAGVLGISRQAITAAMQDRGDG